MTKFDVNWELEEAAETWLEWFLSTFLGCSR